MAYGSQSDKMSKRAPLTRLQATHRMRGILSGKCSVDDIRSFLLDFNAHEATSDELAGFLSAVREAAKPVSLSSAIAARAIDIVGTGGDKSGSVNEIGRAHV